MRDRRDSKRLDILGYHEIAAEQQRPGAGELNQIELGARAGADRNLRMVPRRVGQRHHVVQDVVVHRHLLD